MTTKKQNSLQQVIGSLDSIQRDVLACALASAAGNGYDFGFYDEIVNESRRAFNVQSCLSEAAIGQLEALDLIVRWGEDLGDGGNYEQVSLDPAVRDAVFEIIRLPSGEQLAAYRAKLDELAAEPAAARPTVKATLAKLAAGETITADELRQLMRRRDRVREELLAIEAGVAQLLVPGDRVVG